MLNLLKMAWRNVGRNKRRSILSALAVGFAVAVLIFSMALQQGSYADMIYHVAHARTGNIQVQHPDYWPDCDLAKKLVRPDEILRAIDDISVVQASAPRIQAAALISVSNRTFGALLQGIDPARERETSTLADVIQKGEFLADDDLDGALLGETLAKNLGIEIGEELVFIGQGADGSLAAGKLYVRGLFKTGIAELDRSAAAAHIDAMGEAFSLYGAVTEIAILLDRDRDRPEAVAALNGVLREQSRTKNAEVLEWPTLMPGVEESIKLDWYSGQIIYAVLVLVVGFGIANTFLMAYLERIHEFGVLLSLGMRPRKLSFLVYAESALLTFIGVAVGVVLGTPLVMWTNHTGIYFGEGSEEVMAEYGMSALIHPVLIPIVYQYSIAIVLIISLLLAAYPAFKAARLKPVEALRHR